MRVLTIALALFALPLQADPVRDIVPMVNAFRAQNGLGPLAAHPQLEEAAERHARDMEKNGFFDHKGSKGGRVDKRVKKARYKFCVVAENIAYGQSSTAMVMGDWAKSPGHRKNMLVGKMKHIGVARGPKNHWVMVLAAPRGSC